MNGIKPPAATTTYCVNLEGPDGVSYRFCYYVTVRTGATVVMREETELHYLHTIRRLLFGEVEADPERFPGRGEYPECDWQRVQIWGDAKVFDGHIFRTFSINVFDELTSAQEMLDLVWTEVAANNEMRQYGCEPVNAKRFIEISRQTVENSPVEDIQDSDDIEAPEMPENSSVERNSYNADYEFLGDATKEAKAVARVEFSGKMVGFTVRRIQREGEDSKLFRTYSGYHGKASQYPINSKGQNEDYIDDAQTLILLDELPYDENGYADCNLIGVFRIKAAERGAYYNLVKLRANND